MDKNLNMPLTSIIMPAYNAAKYIGEAILSVTNQTYTNWELIIVDDGSTDNTAEIVKDKIKSDNRIILLTQTNKKQAAARNAGIRISKGDWIAFLDADDIWLPAKLEIQHKHINTIDADVFFTGGQIVDQSLENKAPYNSIYGFYSGAEMQNLLIYENIIPILSVIFNAKWVDKIGRQDENLIVAGCEDWDYWLRMAQSGANFYGINEKLFYYRRHAGNVSGKGLQIAQAAVLLKNVTAEIRSKGETRSYLKKLIGPLITRLVAESRKAEAIYLLKGMKKIDVAWVQSVNIFLIGLMGKHSFYPVRLIMRINKFFQKYNEYT